MARRSGGVLLLAAVLVVAGNRATHGHAVLRLANPVENAALDQPPATIRLTFSEAPDIALSQIRVVDGSGSPFEFGQLTANPADPLSVSISLRPLQRGVYTVSWRIVSAVDGHVTSGAYAFGLGENPGSTPAPTGGAGTDVAPLNVFARWLLLTGLVLVVGAATATVTRFGGASDVWLGAIGAVLASSGVVLLALEQISDAAIAPAQLLASAVGRSLLLRLIAVVIAAAALIAARCRAVDRRRPAMTVVLIASLAAIAVHVSSGHAAASGAWMPAQIASQWAHVVATGIWFGGLFALLIAGRGAPSAEKAAAVRRFSAVATVALVAVALTGAVRTAGELRSWSELSSTAYGQAVLAKVAIMAGIVAFATFNHWRSVVSAAEDLCPLRTAGAGEVVLATGALAAAALLASMPPPAAGAGRVPGFAVAGADFGTTLRVHVAGASDRAGPNRFVVTITDYDSGDSIDIRRATLRFTTLDDSGIAPGSLELTRQADGIFVGSGSALAIAGRWRLTVLVEREGNAVEVGFDDIQIKAY